MSLSYVALNRIACKGQFTEWPWNLTRNLRLSEWGGSVSASSGRFVRVRVQVDLVIASLERLWSILKVLLSVNARKARTPDVLAADVRQCRLRWLGLTPRTTGINSTLRQRSSLRLNAFMFTAVLHQSVKHSWFRILLHRQSVFHFIIS